MFPNILLKKGFFCSSCFFHSQSYFLKYMYVQKKHHPHSQKNSIHIFYLQTLSLISSVSHLPSTIFSHTDQSFSKRKLKLKKNIQKLSTTNVWVSWLRRIINTHMHNRNTFKKIAKIKSNKKFFFSSKRWRHLLRRISKPDFFFSLFNMWLLLLV